MRKLFIYFFCLITIICGSLPRTNAALSRSSWVVNEIYNYNHLYAAQLPSELANKMTKMSANPFAFYRGTAHLFYKDMRALPTSTFFNYATSSIWLNGDIHLQNLGAFRDANGNNVFDTTDFDENYWGPYIYDLRRMAVSIMLTAKEKGLSPSQRQSLVRNFIDSYLNKLEDFKGNSSETTYRLTTSNTNGVVKDTIQTASAKTRAGLLSKFTVITNSQRKLQTLDDLKPITSATYSNIQAGISNYIQSIPLSKRYASSYYTIKDIKIKLNSGIGSLGKYRYYLLIEGSSNSTTDDVILEMKQATNSAVSIAAPGQLPPYIYDYHEGQRIVIGTKAMLNNTEYLVGYTSVNGIAYSIREKSPYQEDFDYTKLNDYSAFNDAVNYFGKIVAKNHALADKDYNEDLIAYSIDKEITDLIAGNKSFFKDEIVSFAVDYADQVELDYQSFLQAYLNGVLFY